MASDSFMRIIELEEEIDSPISKDGLDDISALALAKSGNFDVQFPSVLTGHKYIVKSKGWVGHIPVGPEIIVKVRPKLTTSSVFGMLEVAYNLKSFALLEGETNVNTIEELFERVASILAHRVLDRARKGLYQAYVTEQDDLAFVRGRIDVRESLKRSLHGSAYLNCEFQQLTHDLEDNQLLLWALHQTSRAPLRRPEVIRAVRQAHRVLSGTVTLSEKGAEDCINRFYHRLNEDYHPLHGLCRLLLEHLGPDIDHGEHLFLPFRVNMPLLFEAFVAEWLKLHAPQNWLFVSQYVAKLKANAELTFRMDIVLKDKGSGEPIAVLDTKYKRTLDQAEDDIKQMVAYAVEIGVSRAFLVYPSYHAQLLKAKVGNIGVSTITFDISSQLDRAGIAFLKQLTDSLRVSSS
jgi:5-methylcytosine-specific restriction enzyme subunit McrC